MWRYRLKVMMRLVLTDGLLVVGLYEDNDDLGYLDKIHSIDLNEKINNLVTTQTKTQKNLEKIFCF